MVNNFLFIEEGSVDEANLRKTLDNCGHKDVKFINYKKGTAKPELVPIENNSVEYVEKIKKETTDELLDILAEYLDLAMENISEFSPKSNGFITHRIIFHGPAESFMKCFKEYIDKRG